MVKRIQSMPPTAKHKQQKDTQELQTVSVATTNENLKKKRRNAQPLTASENSVSTALQNQFFVDKRVKIK